MSTTQLGTPGAVPPVGDAAPRVRHQARDALRLMSFSAATSLTVALGLLALSHLGR